MEKGMYSLKQKKEREKWKKTYGKLRKEHAFSRGTFVKKTKSS